MVKKSRFWSFVYCPNSELEFSYFINSLKLYNIDFIVSPLHDRDTCEGNLCKPHYHFLLLFHLCKSFDEIKELTDLVNASYPFVCNSPHFMIRYFCHLDHPNKVQYNIDDVMYFGSSLQIARILFSALKEGD